MPIRPATEADLPAIVALLADDPLGRTREDASVPLDPAYRAAFDAVMANPAIRLVVLEDGGAVVGTLQLTILPGLSRRGAGRGIVEAVRVASPHRGKGLGARLMAWAVEECRRQGCRTVQLTTDRSRADAHRFYERLGFKASHLGYKMELGAA